ncbi:MAG: hypothetical protein A3J07_03390 [Candidatus Doudnabacteria bacterium RIFCSPLOWO2_02_FULL_49_13]|uniref:AB hydrolase-1 domain-containing protein n=1 Tax=Candidatus Doudnabacteria bacterium RIFCSPHIGHO2_12_FULL_48_16 TaxID=1817838 RepID=A0A1F5PJ60_9BACT|nr:MAG: hypothetical protein A3B77_02195 [Candidatus Doudnabacteria bacterium RIFCSPHIGHO2_02_FULL_49_24]OGE89343.1 MAG: hypothetical protein A2760_03155 [Candidatus Doudnabacteria bacterium RIFCSPHIGHO2_01_FULL_50_67]OGE89966.1 MAG: hypothetical protein A3E29_02535 [Candidatus Doudnabacteria bacterium RIFCSPHIGHO2_12_FULL_48_16]OGE97489.1 MAG: hypothetical protein A2990_02100 [Candidatus Doudnabacteria bacterium RIFCSPLOWO2_01_FULL_49_40]OGF03107.1 MAG: hypothetical protein A3J07_03390 [Candid
MELVKIPSGKNKLAAAIHRSTQVTDKLAILCPGYLDSKDYNGLLYLANDLAAKGYTVVRFDPTGTWESEGSISDYTTTQYLNDIRSVKNYMLANGTYNFLLAGGHSMGGRMSLLYAESDPDISKVLAIMSSNKKTLRNNRAVEVNNRDIPGNPTQNKQYSVPLSFFEDSSKYDTLDKIKGLHIPILLIAGEKDTICPPETIQKIFDEANEPKKFILVRGVGHDYRRNLDEVKKVNQIILDAIA